MNTSNYWFIAQNQADAWLKTKINPAGYLHQNYLSDGTGGIKNSLKRVVDHFTGTPPTVWQRAAMFCAPFDRGVDTVFGSCRNSKRDNAWSSESVILGPVANAAVSVSIYGGALMGRILGLPLKDSNSFAGRGATFGAKVGASIGFLISQTGAMIGACVKACVHLPLVLCMLTSEHDHDHNSVEDDSAPQPPKPPAPRKVPKKDVNAVRARHWLRQQAMAKAAS